MLTLEKREKAYKQKLLKESACRRTHFYALSLLLCGLTGREIRTRLGDVKASISCSLESRNFRKDLS